VTDRLSRQLRTSGRDDHRRAEQSPYLAALVDGSLDRDGYAAMVAQHYFIYDVLEQASGVMRDDPMVGPFVTDRLTRLPALERDLRFLLGPGWRSVIEPSSATARYTARLREVCFAWNGGFLAHHYTRYLGDLSGGFYIAEAVRRAYALGHDGTEFYVFDGIPDPAAFKANYRGLLDATDWSAEERARIVEELRVAYQLNIDVLDDLGSAVKAA
jgi:heme oxygenase (biliverdin-producing, ferredoxin)